MSRRQRRQYKFLDTMEERLNQASKFILSAKQVLDDAVSNWDGYTAIENNATQKIAAVSDRDDAADDLWAEAKPNLEAILRRISQLSSGTPTPSARCTQMKTVLDADPPLPVLS